MVVYVRTRAGYDEIVKHLGKCPSPLWVDRGVLTEQKIRELRSAGLDVTPFTGEPGGEPDVEIIRLHHPNDVVWVEF